MHEIRINKEEEKTIVEAKFKVPTFLYVIFAFSLFGGLLDLVFSIVLNFQGMISIILIASFLVLIVASYIVYFLWILGIKRSKCVITNKRIFGVVNIIFIKRQFNYRFDEVDNVEILSSLGVNVLALNFTQGHGSQAPVGFNRGINTISGAGTFRISCIENIDEVYEKLSELITSVKNDNDLMVDIEMTKVEAENRKAAAFEKMAENVGNNSSAKDTTQNYIEELKGLKELLDAGIISASEFEEKKKELLKK